jgi:hypothetical protein
MNPATVFAKPATTTQTLLGVKLTKADPICRRQMYEMISQRCLLVCAHGLVKAWFFHFGPKKLFKKSMWCVPAHHGSGGGLGGAPPSPAWSRRVPPRPDRETYLDRSKSELDISPKCFVAQRTLREWPFALGSNKFLYYSLHCDVYHPHRKDLRSR